MLSFTDVAAIMVDKEKHTIFYRLKEQAKWKWNGNQ